MQLPVSAIPLPRILDSRIMVIEDDPINQRLVVEVLRHRGFQHFCVVSTGEDTLSKAPDFLPDLVILDLVLPDTDGFTLCQKLRAMPFLSSKPILAFTGLEKNQGRLAILEMGADDLLTKPVDPDELIARCRIHLERHYILKDLQEYQSRIQSELEEASALQQMLMPSTSAISDVEFDFNIGISALFAPSKVIGGDFWGFRTLNEHKIAIFLGDFTGHGITSSINVFRFFVLLDRMAEHVLENPLECMQKLNKQLHQILPTELFATLFYGVIDTQENSLRYCKAGCPSPILISEKEASGYKLLTGIGLPIGISLNASYTEYTEPFHTADSLLLYSDALIETPDQNGHFLCEEMIAARLVETAKHQAPPQKLLHATTSLLREFTEQPVEDDLTIAVYSRLPAVKR